MWNLSGDDIQRAKEELKGRRAAIQAHYDKEINQVEAALAGLEAFERDALNFVLNYKGEAGSAASVAAPEPVAATIGADPASEQSSATSGETPVEQSVEAEPAAAPEPVAA